MNDEPTEVYIDDKGVIRVCDTDHIVTCSWFARCTNDANGVVDHPILGGVPTCKRCMDKL